VFFVANAEAADAAFAAVTAFVAAGIVIIVVTTAAAAAIVVAATAAIRWSFWSWRCYCCPFP